MKKASCIKVKEFACSLAAPESDGARVGTCVAMGEGVGGAEQVRAEKERCLLIDT